MVIAYDDGRVTGTTGRRATGCPEPRRGATGEHGVGVTGAGSALVAERTRHSALGLEPAVGLAPRRLRGDRRRRRRRHRSRLPPGQGPLPWTRRDRDRVQPADGAPTDRRRLVPPHATGRTGTHPQRGGPPLRPSADLHLHRDRHRADRRIVPLLPALLTSGDLRRRSPLRAGRSCHGAVPMADRAPRDAAAGAARASSPVSRWRSVAPWATSARP